MQFIITAYDGENALERRMAARPRHLDGVEKLGNDRARDTGVLKEL